ncbi:MAG: DegV family protein [Eubacteriaceae bacterium]|jgi:DegV family protein with EDD domain
MLRLLTDSMCDMPLNLQTHPAMDMVSLNVVMEDGTSLRDKTEITIDEINELLKKGIMPTTTQVLPEDFRKYFTEQAQAGNDVLYWSFTSKLSGTYETAKMVLEQVKKEYPDFNCEIVDSLQSGGPIGLVAVELLKLMDDGASLQELVKAAYAFRDHVHFLFTMQNLKWLAKGGRLGKTTAYVGDLMKIRPVISVEDGVMKILGKVRGDKKALSVIEANLDKMLSDYRDQLVGIAVVDEATCEPLTERMEAIAESKGLTRHERVKIGTVLASHLGVTGTGIYFWDEDPNQIIRESGVTAGGHTPEYAVAK